MNKSAYQCQCSHCQEELDKALVQEDRMVNQIVLTLNEKQRRQFVGLLAKQHGYGGIERLAEITGLHRATISRGQRELENATEDEGQIRGQGGGRRLIEKKIPGF